MDLRSHVQYALGGQKWGIEVKPHTKRNIVVTLFLKFWQKGVLLRIQFNNNEKNSFNTASFRGPSVEKAQVLVQIFFSQPLTFDRIGAIYL